MLVGFELSRTIPLRQFENVKVTVSAEEECEPKDREKLFAKLRAWVTDKVEQEEEVWAER